LHQLAGIAGVFIGWRVAVGSFEPESGIAVFRQVRRNYADGES
jgi:hypothetical protein